MKKHVKMITSLLMAAVMILGMLGQVTALSHPFTDVPAGAYYADAVEWGYQSGIAAGTSLTTFSPDSPMTRAMMVTMLYRQAGSPAVLGNNPFVDVPVEEWYTDPVTWAAAGSVVNGTAVGYFSPNDNITREDIVVILWRFAGYPWADGYLTFADSEAVSDYAYYAVNWASVCGIVGGKGDNMFDPKGLATRAEVMTILYRYFSGNTVGTEQGHQHEYTMTVTKEATCSEEGISTYTCSCGDSFTLTLPAAHKFTKELIKAPTHISWGHTKCTCIYCGFTYDEQTRPLESTDENPNPYPDRWYQSGYTVAEYDKYLDYLGELRDASFPVPDSAIPYATENGLYFEFAGDSNHEYDLEVIISKNSDLSDFWTYIVRGRYASPEILNSFSNPFDYSDKTDFFTGRYYYAVRAIKLSSGQYSYSNTYGPWSETKYVDCVNTSKRLNKAPNYSYEVYLLDNLGTDLLSEAVRMIYIKTDNPDPKSMQIMLGNEFASAPTYKLLENNVSKYNDITYDENFTCDSYSTMTPQVKLFSKVAGGYVFKLYVSEYSDDVRYFGKKREDFPAGLQTVELREIQNDGYTVGASFQMNVIEANKYFNDWIREVIATQTTDDMNPLQKMQAVVAYLDNGQFRYLTKDPSGTYLTLASDPNYPMQQTKHMDSWYSPHWLTCFANAIGGFEDVHNYYSDYLVGTNAWMAWHYIASVTYEGKTYYFSFCPRESTGYRDKNYKIDFSDTSSMTRVS